MEGERNDKPGYMVRRQIFAVGYMKGLLDTIPRRAAHTVRIIEILRQGWSGDAANRREFFHVPNSMITHCQSLSCGCESPNISFPRVK